MSLRDLALTQTNLVDMVLTHAQERPDAFAYKFYDHNCVETDRRTYGELAGRAKTVAKHLELAGLSPQETVVVLCDQGLDFVDGFMGSLFGGFIAVPCNPPRSNRKMDRLWGIIRDCQPSAVLTTAPIANRIELAGLEIPIIEIDSLLPYKQDYERVTAEISFLQYTSGSTGEPKGVMVSSLGLMKNLCAIEDRFCYHFCDESLATSIASWLPVFHDMGLIGSVLCTAMLGTCCHLMHPTNFIQHPESWLALISKENIRAAGSPNFGFRLCSQIAQLDTQCSLKSWNTAWNGAEPIIANDLRKFTTALSSFGFRSTSLVPGYGLAENTLIASGRKPGQPLDVMAFDRARFVEGVLEPPATDDLDPLEIVNCGPAVLDHEIIIVHPESREKLGFLSVGEIWLRGPSVALGYWNNSVMTDKTFRAFTNCNTGPFLRTGDLGFLNENGELFVTGRLKDLIIVRGTNHLPHDIETTVESAHEDIQPSGVAAFAVTTAEGEKVGLVAEIKRTRMRQIDGEEICCAIRRRVSAVHGVPVEEIALIKPMSLLKTTSGKVQRSACRTALENRTFEILHHDPS